MNGLSRTVLLSWLLLVLLGCGGLWWSAWTRAQVGFDTDARILHRVLSQKMAQQEAVLGAVDALEQQGLDARALGRYVNTLLRPYPQVIAVQRCTPGGCQTYNRTRAQTLPDLPPRAGTAQPAVQWPSQGRALYALVQRRIRVWVDAGQLIQPDEQASAPLHFDLRRPGTGQLIWASPAAPAASPIRLSVSKTLGTASQAFAIQITRSVPWSAWPFGWMALWSLFSALGAAALHRLVQGRASAQRAVLDERARAQGVVLAATEGVVALDLQHRVTLANPAARQMLNHPLPLGTDLSAVATFRASLSQPLFGVAEFWNSTDLVTFPEGLTLCRADLSGQVEHVLVEGTLVPLVGSAGVLQGRVLTLREVGPLQRRMLAQLDVSERRIREHEETLAHVSRASTLGEMGAGLAHELNQPLTAVVSYGQATVRLLADPKPDLPAARRATLAMVAQAQRAAEIITRLRRLVRRAPSQTTAVDLTQSVHNILTLCRADIGALGLDLQLRFPTDMPLVLADPVQLEQVILNLLRNALDALRDAPHRVLELNVAPSSGGWQFEVRDSGPGLSPDVLNRLFVPFTTTKPEGLGLGLTLSQTLAQGMGGELQGGNLPGGGARFVLTLNRAISQAADD